MGFKPTTRVKTTGTLTEKLVREHGIQLTRINDVAGARIVVAGGRASQAEAVSAIVKNFTSSGEKQPQIIDRRSDPRQGYRAVHVVVFINRFAIEVQVRTQLQDSWAQIFERVADQWGRQIRYGGEAEGADKVVVLQGELVQDRTTRAKIVDVLQNLSSAIDAYEVAEEADQSITRSFELVEAGKGITELMESLEAKIGPVKFSLFESSEDYARRRQNVISTCSFLIKDRRRRNRIIRRSFPKDPERVNAVSYSRGVDTITGVVYHHLVQSREERKSARRTISMFLSDLSQMREEEDIE